MKKLLLIAAISLGIITTSCSPDPHNIIERFYQETNLMALQNHTGGARIDMNIEMSQGELSQNISFNAIIQMPEGKLNMDMSFMDESVKIIFDGTQGWASFGDVTEAVEEEAIKQYKEQLNLFKDLNILKDAENLEFVEEKDGLQVIRIIPKEGDDRYKSIFASFEKSTGLLKKLKLETESNKIEVDYVEYKKFGDLTMPILIKTSILGGEIVITINEYDMNFKTTDDMFAEPKAITEGKTESTEKQS